MRKQMPTFDYLMNPLLDALFALGGAGGALLFALAQSPLHLNLAMGLIGIGCSPVLMAASNSSGGVMGKMIDAQSIVVASVATGGHKDSPDAGTVLRAVFWHSVALAVLVGLLVMAQAYLWPAMVPGK